MTPYFETKLGKLYWADCLDVMKDMTDKSVDLVFTSPPYNLIWENSNLERLRGQEKNHQWYKDQIPEEIYQKQQKQLINECLRVCAGSVFYNHKVRYAIARRGRSYSPIEWLPMDKLWCEIIWDRCGTTTGNVPRFLTTDERIYQLGRPKVWNNERKYTNIWRVPPVRDSDHVCPFPIELPKRAIVTATEENDIIFDPYLGSGTTAIAAEKHGRRWIGIETSLQYCEIAAKRIKAEASQKKLFYV